MRSFQIKGTSKGRAGNGRWNLKNRKKSSWAGAWWTRGEWPAISLGEAGGVGSGGPCWPCGSQGSLVECLGDTFHCVHSGPSAGHQQGDPVLCKPHCAMIRYSPVNLRLPLWAPGPVFSNYTSRQNWKQPLHRNMLSSVTYLISFLFQNHIYSPKRTIEWVTFSNIWECRREVVNQIHEKEVTEQVRHTREFYASCTHPGLRVSIDQWNVILRTLSKLRT